MAKEITRQIAPGAAAFSDAVWMDVLSAVDRTYADLVDYQEQLERQNAEMERLRSFLGSVLASVSDVLVVAGRGGLVEEVSASLVAQLGAGAPAPVGRALADLFVADDRPALEAAIARMSVERRPAMLEAKLDAAQGPVPVELSLSPRFDDRGRMAGMVLTGRPLGELRQAYAELAESHDELKQAQAQLVRNEKLASLGRLLAGVAHELNNPISFVYANAHALERYATRFETYFARVEAGASRAELVALREDLRLDRTMRNLRDAVIGAREGAERVRDIVEDLRRLSSDGAGEMVDFDLAATASVATHWVLRGAERPVEVTYGGLDSLVVRGRPGHVQQVVMNLVQNAVDALEDVPDPRLEIVLGCEGPLGILEVRDNGPGVPETQAASIFDPFFTTKPAGRGTGLGLSISHKIAQEHGGRLRLCPGGRGACFRLELPRGTTGGNDDAKR
ncbi:sensor histidine kinase [Phaeovulum vinaykumarii]|uniref:histidine kinase n=1 Tax=Phaeovulum vinaykumarii TaxID=407234 RepID=A0A1N7LA36_9RHOB|nr:ATP-binding protein [Phaeovulum vinaykumarii]SIS70570.1 two-component system, NtrC family, sensor histidine kinase HupT/HoxJ [Phaeovulum vinaykumarii]SOB98829.1 two-component system sensor histidine kinase HupT/HoxJ [Phaeovulum vinaykumarii]